MNRNKSLFLVLVAGAFAIAAPRTSDAYTYSMCDGQKIVWSGQFAMQRVECSFPTGSDEDWGYYSGGWNWWQLAHVLNWNFATSTCTCGNSNDGSNLTCRTARSNISGALGLTRRRYSACGFGYHSHIVEADVLIADDLSFAPQDESFYQDTHADAWAGRAALVHEFGHAVGLEHADNFNMMRVSSPAPLAGGNTAEPYPDDANGIRFLYPGASTNLFSSAEVLSGGAIVETGDSTTHWVHWGDGLYITVSVANNGTSSAVSGFRVFINSLGPPAGYTGGYTLWSGSATNPAGTYFSQVVTTSVPWGVPNGLYYIYWAVDNGNAISEYNEGDNVVHSSSTLQVY